MMRRKEFVIIVLVFLGSVLFGFCPNVKASAQATILSHSGYIDALGFYKVVGEVRNTGDINLEFVEITATFYDSVNNVVDTSFTYADLRVLLVGRKSPFALYVYGAEQSAKVDHYSLYVTYDMFELGKPQGLEILSSSSYTDGLGWMHVVGEIKNVGVYATTYVEVIATFYNVHGEVVDCSFTYSDPHELDANQKASFEILLMSDRVPLVHGYELTAKSDQYAIIPEFFSAIALSIFMIATLLAVLVYRRRKSKVCHSTDI